MEGQAELKVSEGSRGVGSSCCLAGFVCIFLCGLLISFGFVCVVLWFFLSPLAAGGGANSIAEE